MFLLLENIDYVSGHGAVNMTWLLIPRELDTAEEPDHPVDGNLVVFLECLLEVMTTLHVIDFDAKVINNETNGDGRTHVVPQSKRVLALMVPLGGNLFFQQLVCKNASLGETLYPHLDLDVDPSIGLGMSRRL
jgi:hypothetical protein